MNLEYLLAMTEESLEEATKKRNALDEHEYTPTLNIVLNEMKERIAVNSKISQEEEQQDPQLMRLDNMLLAEGVATESANQLPTAPINGSEQVIENQEYKTKLKEIRTVYHTELARYHRVSFSRISVIHLLI